MLSHLDSHSIQQQQQQQVPRTLKMLEQLGEEKEERYVCRQTHRCGDLKEFASERYLMSAGQSGENRTHFKSPDLSKTNEDDELFHVLVTKPEIAGKPRDNIIFEGDMDLKTTFETTYEALAKLRLAHWKKYQESRTDQEDNSDCKKQRLKRISLENEQTVNDDDEEDDPLDDQQQDVSFHHKHPKPASVESLKLTNGTNDQRGVADIAGSSVNSTRGDRELCPQLTPAKIINQASPLTTRETTQPTALTTTTTTATRAAGNNGEKLLPMTGKCPLHSMKSPVNSECSPTTELQFNELTPVPCSKSSCSNNNINNNSSYDNYIDPDLSIIVYDANLNRLERLGLRKRSKYRPSTSLRPGARGFFGDQEQLKYTDNYERNKATDLIGNQADSYYPTCRDKPTESRQTFTSSPTNNYNSENLELIRAEQAMSARNLMSSHQGFNLLYSSQNLPVDSKRRCKDNVNMIDHIKEQNIVEHHLEQQQQHYPNHDYQCICTPSNQTDEQDADDDHHLTREELKDLAEQEEAEAVKEIQLITSNPVNETQPEQAVEYVRDADSRADDDLRQSKLRRTCQNQNFSIYNNDYRDTSVGRDGISNKDPVVKKLSTRMSPNSTNLFKESSSVFL